MASSLARLIGTMPVPLFGSARTAGLFTMAKARTLPKMAGWALPLGVGALWFVWPAIDNGWKIEMGIVPDPEAAAKKASNNAATAVKSKVELPPEVALKVEFAYKVPEYMKTEDDILLTKAFDTGDYSELEAKWDTFAEKSSLPGEGDDDDEEEDDDDDNEDDDDDDGTGIFRNEIILEKL